ncbi:hypothetical protein [Streptomyces sp. NPDC050355]|uniref:hypothetical protein n=1 Tax=Streptomyces sp. NPDC050355 TaxID=3365609 RepID=UPI0037A6CEA6
MSKARAIRNFLDAADRTDLMNRVHGELSHAGLTAKNDAIHALHTAKEAGASQDDVNDAINARNRRR